MLNTMFTNNPKPSKHARAILAKNSGLSMRVIQVFKCLKENLKNYFWRFGFKIAAAKNAV